MPLFSAILFRNFIKLSAFTYLVSVYTIHIFDVGDLEPFWKGNCWQHDRQL